MRIHDATAIVSDDEGRTVLSDEALQAIANDYQVYSAGAGTNSGSTCGGSNEVCRNTSSGCSGSTNATCTNSSYLGCGEKKPNQQPPL